MNRTPNEDTNEGDKTRPASPSANRSQQDELRRELSTLHELLEDVQEVSAETKDAMRSVATDLRRLLERGSDDNESADSNSTEDDDWSQLGTRWRAAVLDFESHHPKLAQAVEQITGLLANVGF